MTPYNEDSSEHRARLFFRGCVGYENKLTRHFADCRALDLSNPTIATSRLDEDERPKLNLGRQWVKNTVVNRDGMPLWQGVSKSVTPSTADTVL